MAPWRVEKLFALATIATVYCFPLVSSWCEDNNPYRWGTIENVVATWNPRKDGQYDIKLRFDARGLGMCRSDKSAGGRMQHMKEPHVMFALSKTGVVLKKHSKTNGDSFYFHTPTNENPPQENTCPFYEKLPMTSFDQLKSYERSYTISAADADQFDDSWYGDTKVIVSLNQQFQSIDKSQRSWYNSNGQCGGHQTYFGQSRSSGSRIYNYQKNAQDQTCTHSLNVNPHGDSRKCKDTVAYRMNAHAYIQPLYYCVKKSNKPALNGHYKFDTAQTFTFDTTAKRKMVYKKANCEQDASGAQNKCSLGLEEVGQTVTPETQRSYSSVYANQAIGTGHARSTIDSPQAWSAAHSNVHQHVTLDLGSAKKVAGVLTQGRTDCCNQYVKSFKVDYSNDNSNWNNVDNGVTFQHSTTDRTKVMTTTFETAVTARYIRVKPQSWNEHISMRVDVFTRSLKLVIRGAGTYPCFQERPLVADEGGGVGGDIAPLTHINERSKCEETCQNNINCKSFSYCPMSSALRVSSGCWMRNKQITASDAQSQHFENVYGRQCKTLYKPNTPCTGTGPVIHHEKIFAPGDPAGNAYTYGGAGGWGGRCTCPDGNEYLVADKSDTSSHCRALSCFGGTMSHCHRFTHNAWVYRKVTCKPFAKNLNFPLHDVSGEHVMRAAGWSFSIEAIHRGLDQYKTGNTV